MCDFIAWPLSGCAVQLFHPFFYSSFAHCSVRLGDGLPLSVQACMVFFLIAWSIVVLPDYRLVKCPHGPKYKLCWECFAVKSVPCSHKHLSAFSLVLQLESIRDLQQIYIVLATAIPWTESEADTRGNARYGLGKCFGRNYGLSE